MNKGEIRTRILEQVDWSPDQSTSFKDKVDRLINRSYQAMALEAPFLFFEDEERILTQADISSLPAELGDRLRVVTTDSNTLERRYLASDPPTQSWADGHDDSTVSTGHWDGRSIEITDGTTTYRRKIREVWRDTSTELGGAATIHDRLTLDVPWINLTSTAMTYRIYTPEYGLPADTIELRSARIYGNTHYPLKVSNQYFMERHEYVDFQGNETGRPHRIFRGKHFQIDAPTQAPKVDVTPEIWTGPEPPGTWDFCYTWCWGYVDTDMRTPRDHLKVRWESAPSPILEGVTHSGSNNERFKITVPNIDHMTGYWKNVTDAGVVSSPPSLGRSGLFARLYIRRTATKPLQSTKAGITELNIEQKPGIFYLLDVIHLDPTTSLMEGVFRGERPDYYTRLKEIHGYQTARFWPMPDDRYEMDLRILRRPQPLVHDHDARRLHEEAVDALIEKTLTLFYEVQGNMESAKLAVARYQNVLQTLTKRYGNMSGLRIRKRAARAITAARETRVIPYDIDDP